MLELSAEDDDDVRQRDGLVDAGELLWKLLLWPGAEEEHRSLADVPREDLLTHAEALGLETVGDLCAHWSRAGRAGGGGGKIA